MFEFRLYENAIAGNALLCQAYGLDEDDIRVIEAAVGSSGSTTENSTSADDEDMSV